MSTPGWEPLPLALDEPAAAFLADCPRLGDVEAARAAITDARADPDTEIFGWVEDDELVAVYALRRRKLNFELLWVVVHPSRRTQRFGRSALVDALRRCGRKPMTAEVEESIKGWFERLGFKTVGRKPLPDGGFRYRLGWYAPRRPDEPGYEAH